MWCSHEAEEFSVSSQRQQYKYACVNANMFVKVPLNGKSNGIWPFCKKQCTSTLQHCLQLQHNHKFLSVCGFCFDRQRVTTHWIHILPPENPQNLFLSVCQQAHPNSDWLRHNVPSISSTETMTQTFAGAACVAAPFYLKSVANRLSTQWD